MYKIITTLHYPIVLILLEISKANYAIFIMHNAITFHYAIIMILLAINLFFCGMRNVPTSISTILSANTIVICAIKTFLYAMSNIYIPSLAITMT